MTAHPDTTMISSRSSLDIAQAEAEADRLEALVSTEAARLATMRHEVESFVARARASAQDPALKTFLDSVTVPAVGLEASEAEARAARLKAVAVRRTCAKAMASQLDAVQAQLEKLTERLSQEEAAAKKRLAKKAAEASAAAAARAAEAPKVEEAEVVSATAPASLDTVMNARPAPRPKFKPEPIAKDERRAAQRLALCTEISFHSDSNFFTGFTNDISEGGVFMATMDVMPVGTEVEVSFSLPGGKKVEAKGEVRWVRELDERHPDTYPGMGIRFTQVPASSVAAIHEFAVEREPMFFPES